MLKLESLMNGSSGLREDFWIGYKQLQVCMFPVLIKLEVAAKRIEKLR